jgi:hypothetical protein
MQKRPRFLRNSEKVTGKLLGRGYGRHGVEKEIREGLKMKRDDALKRVDKEKE